MRATRFCSWLPSVWLQLQRLERLGRGHGADAVRPTLRCVVTRCTSWFLARREAWSPARKGDLLAVVLFIPSADATGARLDGECRSGARFAVRWFEMEQTHVEAVPGFVDGSYAGESGMAAASTECGRHGRVARLCAGRGRPAEAQQSNAHGSVAASVLWRVAFGGWHGANSVALQPWGVAAARHSLCWSSDPYGAGGGSPAAPAPFCQERWH